MQIHVRFSLGKMTEFRAVGSFFPILLNEFGGGSRNDEQSLHRVEDKLSEEILGNEC